MSVPVARCSCRAPLDPSSRPRFTPLALPPASPATAGILLLSVRTRDSGRQSEPILPVIIKSTLSVVRSAWEPLDPDGSPFCSMASDDTAASLGLRRRLLITYARLPAGSGRRSRRRRLLDGFSRSNPILTKSARSQLSQWVGPVQPPSNLLIIGMDSGIGFKQARLHT